MGVSPDPRGAPRLGVLGGSFDPPHFGHLAAAQEVGHRLGLQQVLFVPARQNPLKTDAPSGSAEQRVRMVELAVEGDPRFTVSRADVDRPAPSYTVDLLTLLQAQHTDAELYFLVGADALRDLASWRQPQEIVRRWRLATFPRAGHPAPDLDRLAASVPGLAARLELVPVPGVDISSRDLRARVAAGDPIRYLVPDAVRRFIEREALYRPRAADG